jgi:hypothetical protein
MRALQPPTTEVVARGCRAEVRASPCEPTSNRASREVLTHGSIVSGPIRGSLGSPRIASVVLFQSPQSRYVRSDVHPIRLKIEIILPRATPLRSSFARITSPLIFRCSASPAFGFRSLFATSLKSGYVFSQSLPRSTSIRPQAFTASRRLLPLSSLQAYFIPQPRPGSSFVQGLLSRRSHPSSSEGACLHAVASSPLTPTVRLSPARLHVHVRSLSASRPSSAPGRVPQVRLFTSPKAAPLFEFHAPPGSRSLDAGLRSRGCRPLMMLRVRCSRRCTSCDAHLRASSARSRVSTFARAKHRVVPRAVLFRVALSSTLAFRPGSKLRSHIRI